MVDWDGLENRCAFTGTVGSNPTLSAIRPAGFGAAVAGTGKSGRQAIRDLHEAAANGPGTLARVDSRLPKR